MRNRTKKTSLSQKQLQEQLKYCFHEEAVDIEISEKYFHNTLLLANRELAQKRQRSRIGFLELLALQAKYMGIQIWIVQGLLLSGICVLLPPLLRHYLAHFTPRGIAALLCCFSAILAMNSIPFAYRSARYRMWEIETASYFSFARLLAAKMLLIEIGDIVLLGAVFTVTSLNTSCDRASILFYLLIPFLLARHGSLLLQRLVSSEKLQVYYGWICFGLPVGTFLLNRYIPKCFEPSFSPVWIGICLILILAYIYRYWKLMWQKRDCYHSVFN